MSKICKNFLIGLFALVLGVTGCIGVFFGVYADEQPDTHGSPYVFHTIDPVNVPVTYDENGYASAKLTAAQGMYSSVGMDVTKPFKVSIELARTCWYGMGLTKDATELDSTAIRMPQSTMAVGPWMNSSALQWVADYTNFLITKYIGSSIGFFPKDGSIAAPAGTDVDTMYQQIVDQIIGTPNTNGGNAYAGVVYDLVFDIRDTKGFTYDAEAQQIVFDPNGSTLTYTANYPEGAKSVSLGLNVTRADFTEGKAYFWICGGDTGDVTKVKLSESYTVSDESGLVTDFTVNGQSATIGETPVFAHDNISFKVDRLSAGQNVKFGDAIIAADGNGVYNTSMPYADRVISITDEGGAAMYAVSFDLQGGSGNISSQTVAAGETATEPASIPTKNGYLFGGWYADSECTEEFDFSTPINETTVVYAKWNETVTITYKLKTFNDVTSVVEKNSTVTPPELGSFHVQGENAAYERYLEVDSLKLTWYSDEDLTTPFDFETAVTENSTIYGKLTEVKKYAHPNAYGWEVPSSFRDDSGTPFMDENCLKTPLDAFENGETTYTFAGATNAAVYSRGLDVTKPIYINLSVTDNAAKGNWFTMAFYDKLTLAQLGYSSGYTVGTGALVGLGWDGKSGTALTNAITLWEIDNVYSLAGDSLFQMNMVVTIAEDAENSVITMGDTVVAKLNVSRSDFDGGYMYITFGTFQACMMSALIYQDIEVEVDAPENGTITAEQNDAAVVVTVTPADGYELDDLLVNGEVVEFTEQADNTYAVYFENWEDLTITAEFDQTETSGGETGGNDNESDKDETASSGCNSNIATVGSVMGFVLMISFAAVLLRKKGLNKSRD